MRWLAMGAALSALVGCGGGSDIDAGVTDAGASATDAETSDAGSDAGADDAGATDAGATDGSTPDSGASDAGASDAGATDAGAPDCRPERVRFAYLASGPFEVGVLCDDLVVCVADDAEAARVRGASSVFECEATPTGPCAGMTCRYADPGGPSVVDEAELAEICAVTRIEPAPDVVCVVYGP